MPQLTAAYGLFYLENRPILLRAVELERPATPGLLDAALGAGFNAIRPLTAELIDEQQAAEYGLAVLPAAAAGSPVASIGARPFAGAVAAQRAASVATDAAPAVLWGVPAEPLLIASAVARGTRGYSVAAPLEAWGMLAPLQRWFAEREEEITASIAALDNLACLQTPVDQPLLEGGFGVLALAGYNPPIVDLATADDADLADYPAALYACNGELDVPDYGKLVVLTLRGATLVTYPRPVQCTPDGFPYRTSFLWPPPSKPLRPDERRGGERALGRRVQVRDGVSALLTEPLGEPYSGPAYYRLPAGQRGAHRDLALTLFGEAVARTLEPDRELEVELVARLSPDGGALLFVINRLAAQSGRIALPDRDALHLDSRFVATSLYSGSGSAAVRRDDGLQVTMAPADVLIVRLG